MNLKIEDLERNEKGGAGKNKDGDESAINSMTNREAPETSISGISVESRNLI